MILHSLAIYMKHHIQKESLRQILISKSEKIILLECSQQITDPEATCDFINWEKYLSSLK